MQNTTNYNLNKPDGTDFAKIEFLNENADIIDAKLKELENSESAFVQHSNNQQIHVSSAEKARIANSFLSNSNISLDATTNYNTIASNQAYKVGAVDGATGAPPESWGILVDIQPDVTYRIQEFSTAVGNRKYSRFFDSGVNGWSPWKQIRFDTNIYQQWNQGFSTYQRFPEYGKLITDWNSATQNGIYMASNASNAPDSSWFIGTVLAHAETFVVQKVMSFAEPNGTMREFERSQISGTWGAWIETSPRKLFQSVSNGKAAIANAITQKGVATSATAEFATMANNIRSIQQSGGSTGKKEAKGTTQAPYGELVVTGLGFKPKVIVVVQNSATDYNQRMAIYVDSTSNSGGFNVNYFYAATGNVVLKSAFTIQDTGFILATQQTGGVTYSWICYD